MLHVYMYTKEELAFKWDIDRQTNLDCKWNGPTNRLEGHPFNICAILSTNQDSQSSQMNKKDYYWKEGEGVSVGVGDRHDGTLVHIDPNDL